MVLRGRRSGHHQVVRDPPVTVLVEISHYMRLGERTMVTADAERWEGLTPVFGFVAVEQLASGSANIRCARVRRMNKGVFCQHMGRSTYVVTSGMKFRNS